jgi:hypothetical protein
VGLEPKNAIVIKADPLKYPVTIKQAVIEHRDLCLGLVQEISVDIDFEVHRHTKVA